jgi:hypothetical protein
MAQSTRQTSLLVNQDWTKVYQSFTNADFTSYDFETLRNSMINYIKTYYPETFNDFLESSEYLALIDMIAFLGQSLAFRTDLNARENFIDTAQRRDSILKLARMLSYNPKRNTAASGLLKIDSIRTSESVYDSNGTNLANSTIHWNDLTNDNWLEQFTAIVNAALTNTQQIGKPGNSQLINGIQTDEYSINLSTNSAPVAPFSATMQGASVGFEAVSGTSVGESYIYEDDPTKLGKFNLLYRNDNNGNGSNNTGFFVFFKQGSLQVTDFTINNAIPNNFVAVNTNNITNSDQWLYQLNVASVPTTNWTQVPALPGVNVVFNNLTEKNLFQVNTRNNDQVNLVFGDGSFANIPQGAFRFFYRTGLGTSLNIGPDDLSFVSIGFSYIGQNNTVESLVVNASLRYTVTNGAAAPTTASIKTLAPQQYYTQNRMITGEDYNIFPLTNFSSIQKIKAVNRTSSGVSLYLDAIDSTGSYSSTNIFGDDGVLYANNTIKSTNFSFLTTNDIYSAIYNHIIPIIDSTEMRNYYYGNVSLFPRYTASTTTVPGGNIKFIQNTSSTSTTTGFLANITSNAHLQVGAGITSNLQFVSTGASLKFTAPTGKYFDAQHVLQTGTPGINGDTLSFYASVTNVVSGGDPYTPNLITLGTTVPDGAILSDESLHGAGAIIPTYKNSLSTALINTVLNQIQAKVNFGLYFDQGSQQWKNIAPSQLDLTNMQWMMAFVYNKGLYEVQYRAVDYTFASVSDTTFYFDPSVKVYDSMTGLSVTDMIKVLKINNKPGDSTPIGKNIEWRITSPVVEADGYVDQTRVRIAFPTTQMTNVPDDPDLFTDIVGATDLLRSGLYYQYKHNSPARNRIDPTPVNIVDLYILTSAYTNSYITWLRDLTGTVKQPVPPTSNSLEIAYSELDNYKAISDTIVYNPARFKPLFGVKADAGLQARFQVVINPATGITENEAKTQIISAMNIYFDPSNWSFGDTFYFSELAAYLHSTLAPMISSIVIVPKNTALAFGNYFQINAEPWEIITSAATVNDIDIITAITAAQLNLPQAGTA